MLHCKTSLPGSARAVKGKRQIKKMGESVLARKKELSFFSSVGFAFITGFFDSIQNPKQNDDPLIFRLLFTVAVLPFVLFTLWFDVVFWVPIQLVLMLFDQENDQ
jgi:hypothetical protein